MADFVELQPGMRVLVPSPEGALAGYFSSVVRRVDRHGVLVDIPRQDGEDLPAATGQPIKMFVQIHGRMYEFSSRIREVSFQLLLDEPGEAKRTERRAFFRLLVTIPGRVTVARADDEDEDDPPDPDEVTIVDLSGGGARIRSSVEYAAGTEFELQFLLEDAPLRLGATIVRSSLNERARGAMRFEAHCMFTEMRPGDQERIVRFVFQKQRELSARGVA